jgi:ligand-binding sensor domain-containing protein/signal transduction histidine kinase
MKMNRFLVATGLALTQALSTIAEPTGASGTLANKPSAYVITAWHIQDGLPSDRVRAVLQTRDGYVWVATFNGLARFDGVHFQRFSDADTPALRNSLVNCLFEDSEGRLWIGSDTGEITWRDGNGFHAFQTPENWQSAPIDRFAQASNGNLYAASRGGLILCIRDQKIASILGVDPTRLYADVTSDTNGQVWAVRYGGGMVSIGPQNDEVTANAPPISTGYRDAVGARHGGLWVRDGNQLRRWFYGRWIEDRGKHSWTTQRGVVLYESVTGDVWVGTVDEGLFVVAPDGSERHVDRSTGLGHDLVSSISEDQEGNMWVGTDGGGLEMLRHRVLYMTSPPDQWQNRAVLAVTPARDGGVWVGTEGAGVYKWADGQFTRIEGPKEEAAGDVRTVLEDQSGRLWAGTQGAGLLVGNLDGLTNARSSVPIPPLCYALYQEKDGTLWTGTQNGLIRRRGAEWSRVGTDLYRCEVRCITQTPDGALWIGMRGGGIARYYSGKFSQFLRPQGLSYEYIWCLCADEDGTVWIGTPGAGLVRWRNGTFANFTTRDGLPSDFICNIQCDQSGNLWIGSYAGIFKVDRQQLEDYSAGNENLLNCFVLDESDGLTSLEIAGGNQPSACKTSDGRLWFATSAGVAVVDPAQIQRNTRPPPVRIVEVLVDGKPAPFQFSANGTPLKELVAPPGGGSIEFRYTALSFSAPQRCRFRYRLEKMDAEWVDAGNRRSAYYSRLPPQQYHFQVIACNNDGVWNNDGAIISFTVLPYFWEKWWFAPLCWMTGTLFAAFIVGLTLRQRHRRRVENLQRAQLVERERVRIARDLHDDLGSGLTDISMTSALGRDPALSMDEARGFFHEIGDRSNDLVNALDEIVWAVNPKNDDLNSLTTYFSQFAERYVRHIPISCRFQIPPDLPHTPLNAEQRHNLFLGFKEALQNTVKHSGASTLHLGVTLESEKLRITLEDDGRGFVEGEAATGADGLRNMRERLQQLGGQCEIHSAPQSGTRVVFILPLTAPDVARP